MLTLHFPVDIITNSNWNTLSSLSGSIQWWHPERRFTHQRRFKWEVQIYQTFQIWNQWYPLVVLTKNAHPLNPAQKVHDGTLHFVNTTFYLPSAKKETLSKCVDLPCMTIDVPSVMSSSVLNISLYLFMGQYQIISSSGQPETFSLPLWLGLLLWKNSSFSESTPWVPEISIQF